MLLEALSKGQKEPSQELIAKLALQIMSLDLIRYLLLDHLGVGAMGLSLGQSDLEVVPTAKAGRVMDA